MDEEIAHRKAIRSPVKHPVHSAAFSFGPCRHKRKSSKKKMPTLGTPSQALPNLFVKRFGSKNFKAGFCVFASPLWERWRAKRDGEGSAAVSEASAQSATF